MLNCGGGFLTGLAFLAQAAVAGLLLLAEHHASSRLEEVYVLSCLGGWATGVTLGHLGKLLSLSVWTWWPRGPRPAQAEICPRRLWLLEALLFALGIECLADGILVRSTTVAYAGSAVLVASALGAARAAATTFRGSSPALRAP